MELERYHDAMERVPFDPNLDARVLSCLEEARRAARPTPPRPRRRILVAALAAALCLAVTAGAYGQLSGLFGPLFGSHPEIVDQSGAPVSARAVSAGYVLTADALFGDENSLYVAMTLTREDGAAIDADGLFLHLEEIGLPGFQGGGYGARVHPGQGETDSVSLAASVFSNDPIPQGETLTLSFDRLARVGEDADAPALAEGDWVLSFPVRYGDLSRGVAMDAPVAIGDTGLTLDRVVISPLSVHVTGGGTPASEGALEEVNDILKAGGLVLTLKDGATLDLLSGVGDSMRYGFAWQDGGYRVHMDASFPDLIPLEEMESLSFCGANLPLDFPGA